MNKEKTERKRERERERERERTHNNNNNIGTKLSVLQSKSHGNIVKLVVYLRMRKLFALQR